MQRMNTSAHSPERPAYVERFIHYNSRLLVGDGIRTIKETMAEEREQRNKYAKRRSGYQYIKWTRQKRNVERKNLQNSSKLGRETPASFPPLRNNTLFTIRILSCRSLNILSSRPGPLHLR